MCSECHRTPCAVGCPNAPDPMPVAYCKECTGEIMPGEEYAVIGGDKYCESCLDAMPLCVLVPLLGGDWKTASEEDREDECYH